MNTKKPGPSGSGFFIENCKSKAKLLNSVMENKWKERLKKMGWLGFLFFLGKGLIWCYFFYKTSKMF
jgi:hypothetical protein